MYPLLKKFIKTNIIYYIKKICSDRYFKPYRPLNDKTKYDNFFINELQRKIVELLNEYKRRGISDHIT